MSRSLQYKLSAAFLGLAVLPLLLAGVALLITTYHLQQRQTQAIQHQVGRGIIAEFRNFLGTLSLEIEEPVRQHGLAGLDAVGRQALVNDLVAFEPMFVDASILDGRGNILARASRFKAQARDEALYSQAALPEVSAAMTSQMTALGQVRYDPATNEPVLGIAVPSLAPATGEVEGLVLVQARFRRIWDIISVPQPGLPDISAYVVDHLGQVIAHRNPSVVLANTKVLPVHADGIGRGLDGGLVYATSGAVVVGNSRFVVIVEQPLISALRLPLGTAGIVGLVVIFAGFGAWFLVLYSRRAIMAPVNNLATAVRGVEKGDLSCRAAVGSDDELGSLAQSFNAMTARIEILLSSLTESEEKFRLVAESTADALVVIDDNGVIVSWNHSAQRIFHYQADEVIGQNISLLMPQHIRRQHDSILSHLQSIVTPGAIRSEPREQPAQRKDGSLFPCEVSLATFVYQGRRFYSGIVRDITARKEAESNIRFLARHDSLTGLANRVVLHERLDVELRHADSDHQICILFIDLDNFKYINDILGHSFGDKLLRQVADRLRTIEGGKNTICRHGGDEFILLAPAIRDRAEAADLAERILAMMVDSFQIEGQMIEVGCTIGITMGPEDGDDAETLIRKADIAMYQAKARGRLGYQMFTPAMDELLADRRRLEARLRRAIKAGEISIHLQPKFSFDPSRVVGFEALVRWHSREFGTVPPGQFIPVAEEAGIIGAIGLVVLTEVLATLRRWRQEGRQALPVAVNLSAVQLRNPNLVAEIKALLEEYDLPAGLLELELTESMLMGDVASVRDIMMRLKDLGIKLSIDDFGTGYSSLSYLKSFPLDVLKIDRSFVIDLPHDREGAAICLAIINMAKALSLEVVAEGVESEEQHRFLHANGCDYAQGFLLGRPMPVEQAERLLDMASAPLDPAP
ncbi:Signal transduction protein [Candidatus Terasakiella magnetica]|nr:Signal transduction protein [Candidatus Terasakiella magnetica]